MVKDINKRITVTIPKYIHEKLSKEAEYEDRSISNMVLQIIKEHYKIKDNSDTAER